MKYAFISALTLSVFLSLNLSAQAEPEKQEYPDLDRLTKLSDNAPQGEPDSPQAQGKAGHTPAAMKIKTAEMKQKDRKSKKEIFDALDALKARGKGSYKSAN